MSDRLDEVKDRLRKATPGPWGVNRGRRKDWPLQRIHTDGDFMATWRGFIICFFERDAVLLANLHSDMNWLIEEVERLRSNIETDTPPLQPRLTGV